MALSEWRKQLRKKEHDVEAKQAVAALDELLAAWPRKRDLQRLLDTCVTALLQEEKKQSHRDFASLAGERLLTWSLLRELIGSWHGDNEIVMKLVEHCRRVLASGPKAERPFAASVLLSRRVGWFHLTDTERKELFLSRDVSIWQETAENLVQNGWREELIRWAPERPPGDQPDILLILSRHKVKEWSKAERKLWLSCARDHPGSVAYLLNGLEIEGDIPVVFRDPIRTYLEKEIARPTVKERGVQEAYDLVAALYVLDRWKKPEDTELLRKYLKHPCDGVDRHIKGMLEKRDAERPPGSGR